jgi:hypothetical protein
MFDFGYRTLQKRQSTISVNLPIAWGRSEGLDRGDLVRILLTDDGCLLIVPAYRFALENKVPGRVSKRQTSTPTPGPGHRPRIEVMPGE